MSYLLSLPDDLHPIIYTFLGPREIVSMRITCSLYYKKISTFLLKIFNTTRILRSVCPMCATRWIDPSRIEMTFNDTLPVYEVYRRYNYVRTICDMHDRFLLRRAHLLCNDCEDRHMTIHDTHDYALHRLCNYTIHVEHLSNFPWVFIMSDSPYGVQWNEYRCSAYINEEE